MDNDKSNVIHLFRNKGKTPTKRATKTETFLDRLEDIYEQATDLHDDVAKGLPPGLIEGADQITKEQFLGYFKAMLDTIDNTCLMLIPRTDIEEDGRAG
jgi:hypothetical protein